VWEAGGKRAAANGAVMRTSVVGLGLRGCWLRGGGPMGVTLPRPGRVALGAIALLSSSLWRSWRESCKHGSQAIWHNLTFALNTVLYICLRPNNRGNRSVNTEDHAQMVEWPAICGVFTSSRPRLAGSFVAFQHLTCASHFLLASLRATPSSSRPVHFDDLDRVAANAAAFARVTHADPRCVASAVAVATAIALMLQVGGARIHAQLLWEVVRTALPSTAFVGPLQSPSLLTW